MSINPYKTPATTDDAPGGPILVYNWYRAGGPLAIGLVIVPLFIGLVLWTAWKKYEQDLNFASVLWPAVPLCLSGIAYGIFSPTLWMEFGEVFRWRKPLWTRVRRWEDVHSVEIMEENSTVAPIPLLVTSVVIGWHVALIVKLDGRNDVIVHVSEGQLARVRQLLAQLEQERNLKLCVGVST